VEKKYLTIIYKPNSWQPYYRKASFWCGATSK